jgi:four helix bundle protein
MNRFLQMATGSASELEYDCVLARNLEFLKNGNYERLTAEIIEVKRRLASMIQS